MKKRAVHLQKAVHRFLLYYFFGRRKSNEGGTRGARPTTGRKRFFFHNNNPSAAFGGLPRNPPTVCDGPPSFRQGGLFSQPLKGFNKLRDIGKSVILIKPNPQPRDYRAVFVIQKWLPLEGKLSSVARLMRCLSGSILYIFPPHPPQAVPLALAGKAFFPTAKRF